MPICPRVLIVDDSQDDADLIIANLNRNEISVASRRVDCLDEFEAALSSENWDVVFCDYSMPKLDAPTVLKKMREHENVPCIIVSGSIGEERAVELMRLGASDFILKDRLARLAPALRRELSEANNRERRKRLEKSLARTELALSRLRRFFPPQIADAILSGEADDPFKWHGGDVIVLFIDLRGFTHFSEIATVEHVMETLQVYYSTIAQIAHFHSGSVGHIAGDGIMMIFNDPLPLEHPRSRALDAALNVREELTELSSVNSKRLPLNFGIGLAEGYAAIGGIGEAGCWDYTVVGTVPNLASRLCASATDGQILISHRFLNRLEESFKSESLGEMEIKGLKSAVKVFNILNKIP